MLLYYYDYYGCFCYYYYHYYDSILFFFAAAVEPIYVYVFAVLNSSFLGCGRRGFMLWTASRVDYYRDFDKKFGICLYEHNCFTFFLSLFAIPLLFSLFKRKKKISVFVAVRERLVFILSSFMVPICTILKVLILVYMQNIPVLQQKKTCYEDKNKKNYSITLIFSEHCTVALLCASISEAKKKKNPLK